ncbi:BCCT family transporter [Kocuria marina]|uniref:Choline/carnitine/betaine transport n=1 Tax=Kocuria marina subsp. indica TaxID=1049583 RepID=A0A1X7CB88_9MICC|nr:BCCT family transporter [Kocuria indica]OXS85404.1 choline transporter [Kocuria indica]RLP59065.1 BCCT family transporter [Kocuria indica]SME93300.1 choline/carnitine/betaine transport [Kocuria indica]
MSTPPHFTDREPSTTPPHDHATQGSTARSRPRKIIDELTYPHGIHPALVPGVGVEDRKVKFGTDKVVFAVTAVLVVGFIAWGVLSTDSLSTVSATALAWVTDNTGWFFILLSTAAVVFMIFIGFTRTGRIKLGRDDEEPEYSFFSWLAMLFAAGMGIGLVFYGTFEPMTYYEGGIPGFAQAAEAGSDSMIVYALVQSAFHWALNPWAIYAVVGVSVAYGAYRRGRAPLISRVFTALLGHKRVDGTMGKLIDVFAIFATLFGTAASLGVGAMQIGSGISIVGGIDKLSNNALIVIIVLLSVGFIISAVSGVSRGIRYLSNINLSLAFVLALFVFLVGPTVFLLTLIPSTFSTYVSEYLFMTGQSAAWGPQSAEFSNTWTVYYWAWWLSWSPFVGMFIAKISRGRTIRQFVTVVLVVPASVCILWFIVFGGSAMFFAKNGADLSVENGAESMLFGLFDQLPLTAVTSVLAMVVIGIFFVTSADSASVVMGTMTQRGRPDPSKWIVIFWGACLAGIAIVMLLVAGNDALAGMQRLVIVSALPFAVVVAMMMVALYRDLRNDPASLRTRFAVSAVEKAVSAGLAEHGDNFALQVEHAEGHRAAGNTFDSHDPAITEWYRQTDENGDETDFAYKSAWVSSAADDIADGTPEGEAPWEQTTPKHRNDQ